MIPKEGKNLTYPAAYRPISILNLDYKILATILATRLSKCIGLCIDDDQTGFIQGRYLKHNIRKVMNMVFMAQQDKTPRVLLSLDAEKAFDSIEWQHLQCVADKFKLRIFFLNWLQILYKDQSALIYLEGHRSERIKVQRGVRQGYPLSPLLFALALEPFTAKIRDNMHIKGFRVGKNTTKIALYADGDVLFMEDPIVSTCALLSVIEQFGVVSGYIINKDKSIFMGFNISDTMS